MKSQLNKFLMSGRFFDENDGNGNDLPGGKTAEELQAEADLAEKTRLEAEAKAEADRLAAEAANKGKDTTDTGKPTDAEAKLLKEVMQHKGKAKELETQLGVFTSALGDVTVDDLKLILAERKDAALKDLEKRGEYDRVLEQVKTENEREKAALTQQIAELTKLVGEKDSSLVDLTVGRAFNESPFIREKSIIPPSIARKEFGEHVDLVDGVAVVYDKPRGASERTPLVGADGKPKSFEDGIQALYASHPESSGLIRAQGKPGAGSTTTDIGTGKGKQEPASIPSGAGRIAAALNKQSQNQ